jgi:molybdate transport system ATP-binding protein
MLRACALTSLASRGFLSLSYGQKRLALLARALAARPRGCCSMSSTTDSIGATGRASTRSSSARASAASAGSSRRIARPTCRGARRIWMELHEGPLRSVKRLAGADLARLARQAEERPAPDARAPRKPGKILLRLEHADLYVDYRPVLRDVNWELRRGEHWAIFGANGAGKSSFLKLIYGDLSPALGGRIERHGIAAGHTDRGVETPRRLVSPELQTDYSAGVEVYSSWWRADATRASVSSMRRRRRIGAPPRAGSILRAIGAGTGVGARIVVRPAAPRADRARALREAADPVVG